MKKKHIIIIAYIFFGILLVCVGLIAFLAQKDIPASIQYGISYNVPYVHELMLDERVVLDAFLDDLGVRHLRMSAHWTLIEPTRDVYDFTWMDRDIRKVEARNGEVIFGVGRRLPRWPECHVPSWAAELSWEEQKEEIRAYIIAVVERYKNSPAITYWQVENEPYLGMFANEHCGDLDEAFLKEEIELVRSLDPSRPILVTDSGNLGVWKEPYQRGDLFGTSVYVYFWNPELGRFKTVLPPWVYRVKDSLMKMVYGDKETVLIELSLEPWLLEPVTNVPIDIQYTRMNVDTMQEILEYARATRYEKQYLWGGEWWYWLKKNGHPEMWERGKTLFRTASSTL